MLRFLGYVHQVGNRGLHAEGHLVGSDSGSGLRIVDAFVPVVIEGRYGFDKFTLRFSTGSCWVSDVMDGVTRRVELYALVATREESGAR